MCQKDTKKNKINKINNMMKLFWNIKLKINVDHTEIFSIYSIAGNLWNYIIEKIISEKKKKGKFGFLKHENQCYKFIIATLAFFVNILIF